LSIGYLKNEGIAVGNDYKAVRANMKVDSKVKWGKTTSRNIGLDYDFWTTESREP